MTDPWEPYEFRCPECRAMDRFWNTANGGYQCQSCGYIELAEEFAAAHAGSGESRPGTHHTATTTIGALVGHPKG